HRFLQRRGPLAGGLHPFDEILAHEREDDLSRHGQADRRAAAGRRHLRLGGRLLCRGRTRAERARGLRERRAADGEEKGTAQNASIPTSGSPEHEQTHDEGTRRTHLDCSITALRQVYDFFEFAASLPLDRCVTVADSTRLARASVCLASAAMIAREAER